MKAFPQAITEWSEDKESNLKNYIPEFLELIHNSYPFSHIKRFRIHLKPHIPPLLACRFRHSCFVLTVALTIFLL